MKIRAITLLLGALCACSKPTTERKDLRSLFQLTAEQIGRNAPCSSAIPQEWSPSLPVPALVGGQLRYRAFFSGWSGRPGVKIIYYDAQGDVEFASDGRVFACSRRSSERRALADEPLPAKTQEEIDDRTRILYSSIEEMGRLYARGAPVLDADRLRVGAFAREFRALAGPGLAPSYRALSPEFWTWAEKNGASSPAK